MRNGLLVSFFLSLSAVSCADESGQGQPAAPPSPLVCPAGELGAATLDVGEVNLNVACQGTGPTIVLLHGYPEAHFSWNRIAARLAEQGYRAVAPDLRGYGLSDRPEGVEPYQMEHLAADVEGLLDAACAPSCVVVGHDWGGTLAFIVAHRSPARVRGIVVISGPHPDIWGRPEVDPVQHQAMLAYVPALVAPGGESLFEVYDTLFAPHVSAAEISLYHQAWDRPGAKVAMNNWYRANLSPEVTLPTAVTVDAPALVLWGTQDRFATPSELPLLPRWLSRLTVREYEGADHFFYLSRTEEVTADIVQLAHSP